MSPGIQRFIEEDVCFDFDDGWTHVVPWDKHTAYRDGMRKVDHGKAMDFVGIRRERALFLIEAKDYRTHRTRGRRKEDDPWVEMEKKVRDTIASLVGAHHGGRYKETCAPIFDALNARYEIKLVFWFDEPPHERILEKTMEERRRTGASFYMQKFKSYLKWLDTRIIIASLVKDQAVVPGLTARSLAQDLERRAEQLVAMLEESGLEVSDDVRRHIKTRVARNKSRDIDEYICRIPFVRSAQELLRPR